ncbi:hypothetical protein [Stenotrophomonas nematodicola]|uniref:Uncharacterized protein n=1 Tax=Stenotrophomonas nematodicola TaxID=2656746 RepID=A0ABW7D2C5_9GAMM
MIDDPIEGVKNYIRSRMGADHQPKAVLKSPNMAHERINFAIELFETLVGSVSVVAHGSPPREF